MSDNGNRTINYLTAIPYPDREICLVLRAHLSSQVDSQSYGGGNTLDGAIGPVLDSDAVRHRAAFS
jgi:hypothetical protein